MFQKGLIWKIYERPKFWDNKNLNFGDSQLRVLKKRATWMCFLWIVTKYTISKGVVLPPKGYGPCKACAWSCPFWVHCTIYIQFALTALFFWLCKLSSFFAYEFILVPNQNFNTPFNFILPLKCYELGNVLQLFFFIKISLWDPHLGSLKSWGHVTHHTHANEQDIGVDD
jgi:hypothetical protein